MEGPKPTPKNYETGYCKPPKHTQWKKGQSGNPSGKRKADESLRAKALRIAREEIVVNSGGTQTTMPRDEAMLRSLSNNAVKGDVRAARFYSELTGGGDAAEEGAIPDFRITEDDLKVMDTHCEWLAMVEASRGHLTQDEAGVADNGEETNDDAF